MSNIFGLEDNQHVTVAIGFQDAAGNPVPDAIDAGTLKATFADGSEVSAVVSADQASILVTATGKLTASDVLNVSCTVGGIAFSGSETFSIGSSVPTSLTLTPGAPATN